MKKASFLLFALGLVLLLSACRQDDVSHTSAEEEQARQSGMNEETLHGELLFQDDRASIYAADNENSAVTLVYGEYSQHLEGFNFSRPSCTTWEADADGDGTMELYLIHTIGSGTGVSVDALTVLEPNGEGLDIFCHDAGEIQARFNASCGGSYDPEGQTLQLTYGESSYTCDLNDFYNKDYIATAEKLVLISGQMIEYAAAENGTVRLSFALSFESDSITSLSSYLPEETAASCLIRFDGTGFELVDDLKFADVPDNCA